MKCFYKEPPQWDKINIKGHIILKPKDYFFYIDCDGDGKYVIPFGVPAGDICDGASMPWATRLIVGNPCDKDNAILGWTHDPLYETHALPRDLADECGRQICIQAGKSESKARLIWTALRVGAWWAWPNSTHQQIILEKTRQMIRLRPDWEKFKTLWFNQYKSLEDLKNRCK